ncbi:MAG: M48 family metallopeptidase [Verrucomicrobia bacterium]|nr:M48 family metallopeptidase [Verrucomicrobiota bacterium]
MWEQIQANRRRSAGLIIGMVMILLVLGYVGGELLAPGVGIIGVAVALVIWGIQMAVYASSPQSLLLQGAFAREIHKDDSPQLFNVVEEMVLASGLGFMPKIYLVEDPAPNAFAVGRKPENSGVIVTSGLLHRLNRDELQGVIAHEIGHLKNRDVQFVTLAAVMLGSVVILSEIIWRSLRLGGRGRNRSSSRGGGQAQLILLVIALLLVVTGPLLARLLYFACSRKREYLADASSAQFTRYPEGLASALEKISRTPVTVGFVSKATAPMFIVNPLAAAGGAGWFSTHPPTDERVRILRAMGGASFGAYEAAFRKTHGGALIGQQSLRDCGRVYIRAASTEGPVESHADIKFISHRAMGYLRLRCNCGLEISVPEGYDQNTIRCIRCGSVLPIPTVIAPPLLPVAPPVIPTPDATPLQYKRAGKGWESFRCACGRTIQLSPNFAAPQVRCGGCQRLIGIA